MAKPFAAFDVDGTIFKSSLVEKVVDKSIESGLFAAEPFNDVFANKGRWQRSNNEGVYQAYLHRLVGTFVEQMAGVEVARFTEVTDAMIAEHEVRKFAFPRKLIQVLKTSHHIISISGSPDILVEPFLTTLEVDRVYGSVFEESEGVFTGQAQSVGDKVSTLRTMVGSGEVSRERSVAVGDTVSDKDMLAYADTAIMFNASATLTNYGREFDWIRVNEIKDQVTALIYDANYGRYVEQDPDMLINSLRV